MDGKHLTRSEAAGKGKGKSGEAQQLGAVSTLLLLAGAAVGRIATRGGSRRDGDVAMAIFASYVIGQFMPLFY